VAGSPFEDSSGVIACLPIRIGDAGAVADQAACQGVLSKVIHVGQTILCRERNDTITSRIEVWIGGNEQGADPLLQEKREGRWRRLRALGVPRLGVVAPDNYLSSIIRSKGI